MSEMLGCWLAIIYWWCWPNVGGETRVLAQCRQWDPGVWTGRLQFRLADAALGWGCGWSGVSRPAWPGLTSIAPPPQPEHLITGTAYRMIPLYRTFLHSRKFLRTGGLSSKLTPASSNWWLVTAYNFNLLFALLDCPNIFIMEAKPWRYTLSIMLIVARITFTQLISHSLFTRQILMRYSTVCPFCWYARSIQMINTQRLEIPNTFSFSGFVRTQVGRISNKFKQVKLSVSVQQGRPGSSLLEQFHKHSGRGKGKG